MPVLTVGAGQTYATISAAIDAAADGDTIQVQAGTYEDDFAFIGKNLTIEGVGGMAHLKATSEPDNGKAIFVTHANITLRNLEFSDTQVGDGNGAGIRYEGGNLTIDNCLFRNNQDGILAGDDPTGSITITNSEFDHNGTGDGLTHNLYVNHVGTLDISNSYFHDAVIGHEIKSRAANTIIQGSTIVDGPNGTASYNIDLPNGGNAQITNDFIEQGPNTDNPAIIHFGGEAGLNPGSSLSISNNIIENDFNSGSALALLNETAITASFVNNQVYGLTAGQIARGPVTESGTTFLTSEPPIPCYAEGTCIETNAGEIPVECLRVGDRVVVQLAGSPQRIIWIGHRRVDCTRHPRPQEVWPVNVAIGAFGAGTPHRELWLSPEHAVWADGVLIPIRLLVNGTTIEQVRLDAITYYHVELSRHDVLLAEGLPVESYLDTGNRENFIGNGATKLHPDFALWQWEAKGCAPLVIAGPSLACERLRLQAIAATQATYQQQPRNRPLPIAYRAA